MHLVDFSIIYRDVKYLQLKERIFYKYKHIFNVFIPAATLSKLYLPLSTQPSCVFVATTADEKFNN